MTQAFLRKTDIYIAYPKVNIIKVPCKISPSRIFFSSNKKLSLRLFSVRFVMGQRLRPPFFDATMST